MMKKLFLLSLLVTLYATQGIFAADPIVIKFSHVVSPNTPKGKMADKFKELAEAKTGGKVKVEVFPNSQLYKDKEEMEALQLGAVQILAPSLSKFGPLGVKDFEVFDLPYIFDSYDDLKKVQKSPAAKKIFAKLEDKGIIGLGFLDNGFKVMSANSEIRKVSDYKGLKMRIQSSKVLDAQMRALKTLPQVMAFSEVYQALQTGVVDGTENPPSNLFTQKMHEVQKYVAKTNHGYLGYAVIVSKKFWDSLPGDIRTQVESAMDEALEYGNSVAKEDNDKAMAEVAASGKSTIIELTAAERAELKKALIPVHKKMESRLGKDLIQSIYEVTGFKP